MKLVSRRCFLPGVVRAVLGCARHYPDPLVECVCAALRDSSIVLSSVNAAALRANLVIRPTRCEHCNYRHSHRNKQLKETESGVRFCCLSHVPQNVLTLTLVEPQGEEKLTLPLLFWTFTVNWTACWPVTCWEEGETVILPAPDPAARIEPVLV